MGACLKALPQRRQTPMPRLLESPPPRTAPAACEDLPELPAEEVAARKIIARYRQQLDWAMHVPEFEPLLKRGLAALSLPGPRRGIGLRALVDSLMLEAKKDLWLWSIKQFRGLLPGATARHIAEAWGLEGFSRLDTDRPLSATRWTEFGDRLHASVLREHRRYKVAQQKLYQLHADLPEKLALRLVYDPAKRADAKQEGCLGLLHAIDKADDGPTPFASYAQQWVTRAIRNYLLGERFPVHVPVNLASNILCETNRAAPGAAAAHPESGLLQPRLCLDAPTAPGAAPVALADEASLNPRDLLNHDEILRVVQDMINQLSEKQREVLVRRYGLGAGREAETLVNIAGSIGISHQQVSMREKRALEKLGAILRPMYQELYG